MPKIPRISGKEAVRAFEKAGFAHSRTRGSHHVLEKDGHTTRLSVPVHSGKNIGVGLLKSLINDAGLTVDEFIEFLKG